MSGFIVPGLLTWSFGTADVSTVPGRACAKICHSRLFSRHARGQDLGRARLYWLPTRPSMFSHCGCAGSCGGFSRVEGDVAGAAGHADQERRLDRAVEQMTAPRVRRPSRSAACRSRPRSRPSRSSACHVSASKRGFGKLAEAERAGRGAELQVARGLPLVLAPCGRRSSGASSKSQAGSR